MNKVPPDSVDIGFGTTSPNTRSSVVFVITYYCIVIGNTYDMCSKCQLNQGREQNFIKGFDC